MKTQAEKLNLLSIAHKVFDSTKKSRTFMTLGREYLSPNFSARGIYATYSIGHYDYFDNHFTNEASDKNAIILFGEDNVDAYLKALNEVIVDDTILTAKVKELLDAPTEVKKQVDEALAELEAEQPEVMAAPTQAEKLKEVSAVASKASPVTSKAAEVVEQTQNAIAPVKPGYGLNLDIDAVFKNAAIEFLTSETTGILHHVQEKIKGAALQNTLVLLPGLDGSKKQKVVTGRLHMEFKEILEVTLLEKQTFLGGPAGTGKTTLGAQIADALSLPFAHISCTAGMSEAHLLGRMVANGDYISAKFVELYENGGVFLVDEVDAADANTTLILNSGLANGYISVPNRASNPTAKRHPNFYLIAAANTFGNGSAEYSGREILDAAFMDRFAASKVYVGYDTDLEKDICSEYPNTARTIWKIRDNVTKARMKRVVSTRLFASAVRSLSAGRTEAQLFARFFTGWTPEEVAKATA